MTDHKFNWDTTEKSTFKLVYKMQSMWLSATSIHYDQGSETGVSLVEYEKPQVTMVSQVGSTCFEESCWNYFSNANIYDV